MGEQAKITTNIRNFQDVTKSLQEIEKILNKLSRGVNTKSEGQVDDMQGKTGDIRVVQDKGGTHSLEVRTEDGWKYGTIGKAPVTYIDKPTEHAQPTAIIEGSVSEPDYTHFISAAEIDKSYTTGATDATYPADIPSTISSAIPVGEPYSGWNEASIVGIPALGFTLKRVPKIRFSIFPPGIPDIETAIDFGCVIMNWDAYIHHSPGSHLSFGIVPVIVNGSTITFLTGNFLAHVFQFQMNLHSSFAKYCEAYDSDAADTTAGIYLEVWK